MTAGWMRIYENGSDYLESLNGIAWNDAPLPMPWHRCRVQTRGRFDFGYIERCPCGAARMSPGGRWAERNRTRQDRKQARREARLPRVQVACQKCGNPYEAPAGTPLAAQRLCNGCWADLFTASGGQQY